MEFGQRIRPEWAAQRIAGCDDGLGSCQVAFADPLGLATLLTAFDLDDPLQRILADDDPVLLVQVDDHADIIVGGLVVALDQAQNGRRERRVIGNWARLIVPRFGRGSIHLNFHLLTRRLIFGYRATQK